MTAADVWVRVCLYRIVYTITRCYRACRAQLNLREAFTSFKRAQLCDMPFLSTAIVVCLRSASVPISWTAYNDVMVLKFVDINKSADGFILILAGCSKTAASLIVSEDWDSSLFGVI